MLYLTVSSQMSWRMKMTTKRCIRMCYLNWLYRRFAMIDDIIRETPAYKVLTKEAHEEGVQEGLERGIELGLGQARQKELQRLRHMLLNIVRARFPKLVRLAKKQGIFIEEPDILDALVVKISIAQTMEEAKYQLLTADEGEEDI